MKAISHWKLSASLLEGSEGNSDTDLERIQRTGRKTGLEIQLGEITLIEKKEFMSEPQEDKKKKNLIISLK